MDLKGNIGNRWTILFIVIIAAFYIGGRIGHNNSVKQTLKWSFKGPVQKVWYDEKNYPYVKVGGKEYYLNYVIWHFSIKINAGDTIIKRENDMKIEIIKPGTQDTLSFDQRSY